MSRLSLILIGLALLAISCETIGNYGYGSVDEDYGPEIDAYDDVYDKQVGRIPHPNKEYNGEEVGSYGQQGSGYDGSMSNFGGEGSEFF